ncbi:dephospho-CoA kinase [Malonomonas rubra]|uniref:dephospho-CoA kinase n=1 Tax=Malonomonas rubra TaxID=57040 RepID=UPI0026ED94E2|nr:dephospho-CoA kinase [Malonomonas rubra]
MPHKNLILGITGSIASGKSIIAAAFVQKGAALVDADQLARDVVAPGSPVLKQLVERFGERVLLSDGQLNREYLSQIVFSDAEALQDLNRIMHPAIGQLAIERLQQLRVKPGLPLVVYEAPLLFEANSEGRVDKVLVVKIDEDIQLQRLMQRDGLNETAAKQRIDAQMAQEEKLARADFVIDNSGTVHEALQQVEVLWERLCSG